MSLDFAYYICLDCAHYFSARETPDVCENCHGRALTVELTEDAAGEVSQVVLDRKLRAS
jgi:Zn finger protein HypA/HybF involved in hydrogenase expression